MRFDSQYHHPFHSRFNPADSRNGVPTFITTYDLKTGRKSEPVYIAPPVPGWTATTGARSASIRRDISK